MPIVNVSNGKPGERKERPSGKKAEDAFLLAMALGLSVPQAAERAGIGMSTGYNRMNEPGFREEVRRARDDIVGRAVSKLADAACESVDTLRAQLSDDNKGLAQRAANMILTHMLRGVEMLDLAARIAALEEQSNGPA